MIVRSLYLVVIVQLLATVGTAAPQDVPDLHGQLSEPDPEVVQLPTAGLPSDAVLAAISDTSLRALIDEVLERNPRLARERALAAAAGQRAPQVSALPDPTVGLTLFLLPPETRVGPAQASVGVSQRFPWFGKLRLHEQAAVLDAAAAAARVEATRLELITETRRLYFELGFLEDQERIVGEDQATLKRYDRLAQARYASGVGLSQAVIKIQAEITRADSLLLEIDQRRSTLRAAANALRDLPGTTPIVVGPLPVAAPLEVGLDDLRAGALARRPELAAADAEIQSAATRVDLAKKEAAPDVTVGLNYGFVGRRDDAAGEAMPPEGNGDDTLSLSGSINLPIWRGRLDAAVEESIQRRLATEEGKRALVTRIEGGLSDLSSRLPLLYDQLRLYEDVLTVQADQSLLSAEAAYAAGNVSSLDLLDAERVRLNVRIAAARVRADHAIAVARLEGEIAAPLTQPSGEEQ